MAQQNILFYSESCIHSKNFINQLYQSPNGLYDTFLRINVLTHRHKVPPIVRSVPTIIVQNCNRPLSGEDCFKWITEMTKSYNNRNNNNNKTNGEPDSYQPLEMGSNFTDSFSFMSDTNDGSVFTSSKGTFFHLNEDENTMNIKDSSNENNTKRAENEIKINQAFERYQKQRDLDIPKQAIRR